MRSPQKGSKFWFINSPGASRINTQCNMASFHHETNKATFDRSHKSGMSGSFCIRNIEFLCCVPSPWCATMSNVMMDLGSRCGSLDGASLISSLIPGGLIRKWALDFPGGAVIKNPPANAGNTVRSLIQEDPTCHGATKPVCHNYWACALQPASHSYWARAPRARAPQEEPPQWEARAPQRRVAPAHCN